jgi:hypothetical protein
MYELPEWDAAFRFTHDRQAINPSPVMFANIYSTYVEHEAIRSRLIGVGSYSEGVAADLNMCITLALAAHNCTVEQAVAMYASFFFGADSAANVTRLLFLLERSWNGGIVGNTAIVPAHALATAALQSKPGWRAQMYVLAPSSPSVFCNNITMYLYRATYDLAVRHRAVFHSIIRQYGVEALQYWPTMGTQWALENFVESLSIQDPAQDDLDQLIAALGELRQALNASIGLTVLQSQQPLLSLEDITSSAISDNTFLVAAATTALALPPAAQLTFIASVLNHTLCPSLPCNYDWLGGMHPHHHPHLLPGAGPLADPDFFSTPLRSFSSESERDVAATPERWRVYAEIFYDNRMVVAYPASSLKVGVDHTLVVVPTATPSLHIRRTSPHCSVHCRFFSAPPATAPCAAR